MSDAQAELGEANVKADERQDQFEEMLKAKLELETALTEAQQIAADRSTDSEARQRDEDLFNAKEKVAQLETSLTAEREEHAKELENATFVLKKDLEEAQARMAGVEMELGGAKAGAESIVLMKDKIARLRKERDELRISLNFINHEQRFNLEAANANRAALDSARIQLDEKTQDLDRLQRQHSESETASTQLEADLKDAAMSRDTLSQQVQELESRLQDSMQEHRLQAEQSGSLVSELALARSKASRAESEMMILRKANHDFEVRVDRLQATLDAKLETAALAESTANQEGDRPGSSLGHRRRRSGLPASLDVLENLKVERADLLGRLSRRDTRIRSLENELKQAKANLQLAEDAASENVEELEEATKKVDEVQSMLDQRNVEVEASKEESQRLQECVGQLEQRLAVAQEEISERTIALRETVLALAVQQKAALQARHNWAVSAASLRETDTAIDRIRQSATTAMEGARAQLQTLTSRQAELESELSTVRSEHQSTSTELEKTRIELDKTKETNAEADARLSELKVDLADTQARLAGMEETNAHLLLTAERVASHESDLEKARKELKMRQTDIEELLAKLASTEKSRGVSESEAAAHAATFAQLEATESEVASLQGQLDTLLEELSGLQSDHDQATQSHLQEIESIRASHAASIGTLSAELDETRRLLETKASELEHAGTQVADLQEQLASQRDNLTTATSMSESDREVIEDLRARVAEMDALSEHVEALKKEIEGVKDEADTAKKEAAASSSAIAELESAMRASQASLESARNIGAEAAERSASLQAQVDALKEENEKSKVDLAKAVEQTVSPAAIDDLQERIAGESNEVVSKSLLTRQNWKLRYRSRYRKSMRLMTVCGMHTRTRSSWRRRSRSCSGSWRLLLPR